MADVHAAWLAAGAADDTASMRQLWRQFPEWLDFNRHVGSPVSDSPSQRQAKFCSWGAFHLRTIGASTLHTAAWGCNVEMMQFLLESGQNPDESGDDGMTAMMVTILRLNLMTMRCVIRDGEAVRRNTVVDCREKEGQQVELVLAVIKLLLQFNADMDTRSQDGKTALHCSTSDDAYPVAKFLLDAGAGIDVQDGNGKTPLHYCVQEGGLLVTELLLSRGASIDAEDKDGVSPLVLMLQRANLNVLQLFLNHHQWVATPQRFDFGEAVLLQAVECRAEEIVRYVVDNEYASVTIRNEKGETPMHVSIKQRNTLLMELLNDLDPAGDNLAATTKQLETPAHYAARYGSQREVEVLLQCLTSVFGDLQELGETNSLNTTDARGMTSLYIAGTTPFQSRTKVFQHDPVEDTGATNRDIRDTKAQLLLDHGARLFPPGYLAHELAHASSSSNSRLIFPARVQHCLRTWIVENGPRSDEPEDEEAAELTSAEVVLVEAVAELCMQWTASVACVGSWVSLLPILICAGYAPDIVPLLVELSLQRWALPALLRQLEKFSRHQLCHKLLLQLHDELLEACRPMPASST
ncbi:hypothetical protein KRP22_006770 [Phytophthora ramorum]|nr:Ankyrin-3 [Phytophthora ramorum]